MTKGNLLKKGIKSSNSSLLTLCHWEKWRQELKTERNLEAKTDTINEGMLFIGLLCMVILGCFLAYLGQGMEPPTVCYGFPHQSSIKIIPADQSVENIFLNWVSILSDNSSFCQCKKKSSQDIQHVYLLLYNIFSDCGKKKMHLSVSHKVLMA